MLIDRSHRPWVLATAAVVGLAAAVYLPYAGRSAGGPRGGSATGLAYGVAGFGLMLYAGLLGARKKVPVWRLGRAQTWMRGHLWLGLATLPLALLHAGFSRGGPLTTLLLVLTVIVVGSGVAGALLQHVVPRTITRRVPLETIYHEIPSVLRQLGEDAERLVRPAAALAVEDERAEAERAGRERLRAFVEQDLRPFLADARRRGRARAVRGQLDALRPALPPELGGVADELEALCEEARQLGQQLRLHRWLHGWILLHAPLSIALLALVAIHAVVALRY